MNSVTEYVKSTADVAPTLDRFQEMMNKYNFMLSNVEARIRGLRDKIPEMRSTLETVRFLAGKKRKTLLLRQQKDNEEEDGDDDDGREGGEKELHTTFQLNPTLYAHATVPLESADEVYLWLGANTMVAYPLDEAEELLRDKLTRAQDTLATCEEDVEFLREQITTLEVAVARVWNWDVGEKRRNRKLTDDQGD